MPFLRQRLARQLIVTTMASAVGVDNDVAEDAADEGFGDRRATDACDGRAAGAQRCGDARSRHVEGIPHAPASDAFVLSVTSELEPPAWQTPPAPPVPNATRLDGVPLDFPNQGSDPSNIWSSAPVQLEHGRAYALEIDASLVDKLSWKRAASAVQIVPAAFLLADDSTQAATGVFVSMRKAALVASGFDLDAAEIAFFQANPADFDGFDLNTFTLAHWKRLRAVRGAAGLAAQDGPPPDRPVQVVRAGQHRGAGAAAGSGGAASGQDRRSDALGCRARCKAHRHAALQHR